MGGVKLKILLFILLSFYSFAFEFSPMGFDKRLDTGEGYGEFQYTNSTLDVQRYKISILDNGKENNISQYVSVYPKILTVKPKSVGVIKIYVQTPPTLKKGLYGFILRSEGVPVPFLQKRDSGKLTPAVSMKTAVNLEMQAYVGEVGNEFEISNEKIVTKETKDGKNKKYYTAKLKNKNGRGYELGVCFLDSVGSIISVIPKGRLGNNGELTLEEEIPKLAEYISFYDYNNQVFVCQKIRIIM